MKCFAVCITVKRNYEIIKMKLRALIKYLNENVQFFIILKNLCYIITIVEIAEILKITFFLLKYWQPCL